MHPPNILTSGIENVAILGYNWYYNHHFEVMAMRAHKVTKAATVRARVEPDVKERAERILNGMGISATQAVNMLYKKVIKDRGWPCELREFNDETIADLEASARGEDLIHFSSAEEMIADLHKAAKEEGIEINDEEVR